MLVDGDLYCLTFYNLCYQVFVLLKIFVCSVPLQQNSREDWTTMQYVRDVDCSTPRLMGLVRSWHAKHLAVEKSVNTLTDRSVAAYENNNTENWQDTNRPSPCLNSKHIEIQWFSQTSVVLTFSSGCTEPRHCQTLFTTMLTGK